MRLAILFILFVVATGEMAGESVSFVWKEKLLRVSVFSNETVKLEVRYVTNDRFLSYAVENELPKCPLIVTTNGGYVVVSSYGVKILVHLQGKEILLERDGKRVSLSYEQGVSFGRPFVRIVVKQFPARWFGFGLKTGDMELTGRSFVNWNTDAYGYGWGSDPIYSTFPVVYALSEMGGVGYFFDSPAYATVSFRPDGLSYQARDNGMDVYLFFGSLRRMVLSYMDLTGRPKMPPFWSLGYQQSRYSYMTQDEVLRVAKRFRMERIPLDVIYMDIDYMDRYRSFSMNTQSFPDVKGMNEELKKLGVRTVAIIDPGIVVDQADPVYRSGVKAGVFLTEGGKIYQGKVWPGMCAFPDFTKPGIEEWWGPWYTNLVERGISGFWNDMNEPAEFSDYKTIADMVWFSHGGLGAYHYQLHNAYGTAMARASWKGLSGIMTNKRVFLLSRAGYSGVQKYAWLWSGDNTSDWSHLAMNMNMAMNMALSGVSFFGADIGGYIGSPSSSLMVRWHQLGAFLVFFRNHTGKDTPSQEPYVFRDKGILREVIKLRYRLLPYLYTTVYEHIRTGEPVIRPLFYEYGFDWTKTTHGFLSGHSVYVIPVLDASGKVVVRFPDGKWYDLRSGNAVATEVRTTNVALSDMLVFVRGGRILPMYVEDILSTDERKGKAVVFVPYWDENGKAEGSFYDDDGETLAYEKGEYLYLHLSAVKEGNRIRLTVEREGRFQTSHSLGMKVASEEEVFIGNKRLVVSNGVAWL